MGQQKGNPTPSYQNQAYETLRPNTGARENRDYGTKPVMIDDTKTLDELIDSGSQGFTKGYAKDTDLTDGTINARFDTLTANEYHVTIVSSSVMYANGSNKFGNSADDRHEFTGSLNISGSLTMSGSMNISGSIILQNGAVVKDTAGTSISFGKDAGVTNQGTQAVAVGDGAGYNTQGAEAVAVGKSAGNATQGAAAVAVGHRAGDTSQGASAIAIGKSAGETSQTANTIILNATGVAVNGVAAQSSSFYVAPIRNVNGTDGVLQYNSTTKEVTYSSTIASPALTGTPTSTTAAVGTNSTQIATTAFVIAENIRLVYKDVDATIAVTAAVNNKVFIATKASATQTFTLPAASTAGLQYTFICGDAGGELRILGIAGNTIILKTAAGGTLLSIAADTGIKNTAATNIVGDTITLVSDGVTFWYAVSQNGIFASN